MLARARRLVHSNLGSYRVAGLQAIGAPRVLFPLGNRGVDLD